MRRKKGRKICHKKKKTKDNDDVFQTKQRSTFSKVFEREEEERNYTSEEGGLKNGNTQASSSNFRFPFFALKCVMHTYS